MKLLAKLVGVLILSAILVAMARVSLDTLPRDPAYTYEPPGVPVDAAKHTCRLCGKQVVGEPSRCSDCCAEGLCTDCLCEHECK